MKWDVIVSMRYEMLFITFSLFGFFFLFFLFVHCFDVYMKSHIIYLLSKGWMSRWVFWKYDGNIHSLQHILCTNSHEIKQREIILVLLAWCNWEDENNWLHTWMFVFGNDFLRILHHAHRLKIEWWQVYV